MSHRRIGLRRAWLAGVVALAVVLGVGWQWSQRQAAASTTVFEEHFSTPGRLPDGWWGSGEVVSDTGYGPPGSLKIVDDSTTAYVTATSKRFPVSGERHYNLTLYVHSDNDPKDPRIGRIHVRIDEFAQPADAANAGNRIGVRWMYIDPTRSWSKHTLNFTTPGAARSARIALFPAGFGVEKVGQAWFDEVVVTTASAATDPVIDVAGRPVPVTSTVDESREFAPFDFWAKVPEAPRDAAVAERSLWSYPLLRRHYFATNLAIPRTTHAYYSGIPTKDKTIGVSAPVEVYDPDPSKPCSQRQRVPQSQQRYVALDIRYRPIVSPHPYTTGCYTRVYFPRRTADHLDQLDGSPAFLQAMTLSGNDPRLATRAEELLSFLQFSQYTDSGDNPFTRTYYPKEFEQARAAGRTAKWKGGWDFNFNFTWRDGYDYQWQLHEADHHVNAQTAAAMARAFEVTGNRAYLDSAWRFVYYQYPRYGWHTGVWNGKRYYWTEYNPAGYPKLDATDNVQALGARVVAMVGYHTGDRRMLEYARGLLWYCVRELTTDGRWYYDGAENPMNQRKHISHDMAVMLPLLAAVPYLLKAGVALDTEFDALTRAYTYYLKDGTFAPFHRIKNGQMAKLPPEWDAAASRWKVTSYFTANRAGSGLVVKDSLPVFSPPLAVPGKVELRVSKLVPPTGQHDDWTVDPAADKRFVVTPEQLKAGVATGLAFTVGDAFRISYWLPGSGGSWTKVSPAYVVYTADNTSVEVRAIEPSVDFPTVVTDATFAAITAKLAFPHDSGEATITVRT